MSKVRKIEPIAKLPETAIKPNITRVAVYARVSTDMEEQASSFEAQKDYYEKKVRENKDWTLVGIYADEGKTGTSYINRTEFLRMIEDCRLGKIDMILTKSVSRFARNTVDALNNIRELKARNIGVFFERENIWTLDAKGEFLITLLTSLAQEESRSISENTTWGKRKAFADGRYSVAYTRFLGYDRGAKKGEFVINEGQARIVRLIYRMYLQGYSSYRISEFLTRWEVRTPTGSGKWHSSSVISILQNEKYKGDALLQKCFTKDFLTHKRVQNNGELPQYYVHDGHEAIDYRFEPGPLTLALRCAFENPQKDIYIIIEEINRGNAAAIFGDLFQLLDRDKSGRSKYQISNADIASEICKDDYLKPFFKDDKIWFPNNLNFLCTMNTADQNVFILDSAFKRRFHMKYVKIDFEKMYTDKKLVDYLDETTVFEGNKKLVDIFKDTDLEEYANELDKNNRLKRNWPTFASLVNKVIDIINKNEGEQISEDKKLGTFYVLLDEISDKEMFADKVLYYLKQDVFKYIDNYFTESYQTMYDSYISGNTDIFELLLPGDN